MVISEPRLGLKRKGAGPEEKMIKMEMGGSGEEKVGLRPKWGKKEKEEENEKEKMKIVLFF